MRSKLVVVLTSTVSQVTFYSIVGASLIIDNAPGLSKVNGRGCGIFTADRFPVSDFSTASAPFGHRLAFP